MVTKHPHALLLLLFALSGHAFLPSSCPSRLLACKSRTSLLPTTIQRANRMVTMQPLRMSLGDPQLSWFTDKGELFVKEGQGQATPDKPFVLKGINWSGFEAESRTLGGLEQHRIDEIAGFLKYWGFNAVRLPISLPMALELGGKGARLPLPSCL